jgi:minor extracellular serine protease Vpr
MKKIYLFALLAGISFCAFAQEVLPTLSPVTKTFLREASHMKGNDFLPKGYVYKRRVDGKVCVSAIIKINNSAAEPVQASLNKINSTIGTKAGNVWTVQIPIENVKEFTTINGISYIQIDEPVIPNLDIARKTTRVDSVHSGYSLPIGYSGKGVIVGVIDFGFDYNHPSFYDTLGNKYRVVKAWEMGTTGTPPAGYSYGHEITDTIALKAKGTDNVVQTHGTGVAGLAAGSGYGGPAGKFRGIAYESEMVFVGVRRDSIGGQWLTGGFSDFIDGVSYLMKYAKSVGKPIVVNISWGSHSGPHDGSSLVNQAFDTLSGQGKIIVMSAGNNGNSNIHLAKTFTSTDTAVSTFLSFTSNAYKRTWVDIWGDTAKTFCVNTTLYGSGLPGATTGRICIDNKTTLDTLIGANGLDTCYVETITSSAEYNLKPRVTINIYNKATDSVGISVFAKDGKINMWDEYYYYGYQYKFSSSFVRLGFPWATDGNTNTTISDMGAGQSTLLVGAYNTKNKYVDVNGFPQDLSAYGYGSIGQYSRFTSRGPYVDGRIKPDICAPGLTIATAANSWDTDYSDTGSLKTNTVAKFTHPITNKDYYYAEFSGTSASSPIAAGIVALLLQIDPTLSPTRVQNILAETAIQDFYTGPLPPEGSPIWGHGKINAYGAVRKLYKELSVTSYSGAKQLDCILFPNPNNGSFNLDLFCTSAGKYSISVMDIAGKQVLTTNWNVKPGQNILPINLGQNSKGIYLVNVKNEESSVILKAVVQ